MVLNAHLRKLSQVLLPVGQQAGGTSLK